MKRPYSVIVALAALMLASGAVQALELRGEKTQGALLVGQTHPESELRLDDRPVRVNDRGEFVIGFGRDAEAEQTLRETTPDGEVREHRIELSQRDYHIQRVEGVPSRTVTPDEEHLERIRAEAAKVREAREADSDRTEFLGDYIWPVEGRITGVYGSQRYYNGEPRQPHYGVDVAAPEGTDVMSPAGGRVILAEPDLYFSGGTLIIDHGFGVSSTLMHLSAIHVEVGDEVAQGDVVVDVGMTGRATGPHLDWRMNWFTERVDPVTVAPDLNDGYTPGAARD